MSSLVAFFASDAHIRHRDSDLLAIVSLLQGSEQARLFGAFIVIDGTHSKQRRWT